MDECGWECVDLAAIVVSSVCNSLVDLLLSDHSQREVDHEQ